MGSPGAEADQEAGQVAVALGDAEIVGIGVEAAEAGGIQRQDRGAGGVVEGKDGIQVVLALGLRCGMFARLNHTRLLRYSGLFTWAVVGLPLLYSWLVPPELAEEPLGLQPMRLLGWGSYLLFGACYLWLTRSLGVRKVTGADFVLLGLLTASAIAESARVNERTRISRELHDLLGHHLTALSLNLEVAGHLVEGRALEHVNQAHTLARLLLSDVREAVSRLRADDAIDMAATLQPLVETSAGLRITLDLPSPFLLDDPERAHVLLRCTQEIITNAVRHAQASELRLEYRYDGRAVRMLARDNGRGAEIVEPGNGLRGMRERLAACGGQVEVRTRPGEGFELALRLPLDTGPYFPAPRAPAVAGVSP